VQERLKHSQSEFSKEILSTGELFILKLNRSKFSVIREKLEKCFSNQKLA